MVPTMAAEPAPWCFKRYDMCHEGAVVWEEVIGSGVLDSSDSVACPEKRLIDLGVESSDEISLIRYENATLEHKNNNGNFVG